jgi:hypothetical protein
MNARLIFPLIAASAAFWLAGCETTPLPPGVEAGPNGTIAYDVLIEASEPGARIEANGENLGNTPLHLKIYGDKDGTFHNFGSYEYIINAFPLVTNQFLQSRIYRTGDIFMPEDKIPQRIFFDMSVQQPPVVRVSPPAYYYGAPYPYPYPYYYPYYYPGYYYGPSVRVYSGRYYHGHHH